MQEMDKEKHGKYNDRRRQQQQQVATTDGDTMRFLGRVHHPLFADPFPRQKPRHHQLSCPSRYVPIRPSILLPQVTARRWPMGRRSHAANVPDPSPHMQWGLWGVPPLLAAPGVGCVRCIPYSRLVSSHLFHHATVAARLASASAASN